MSNELTTTEVYTGRTFKRVTVMGAEGVADADVIAYARTAARETPGSLYGTNVERHYGGVVVVTLHTD